MAPSPMLSPSGHIPLRSRTRSFSWTTAALAPLLLFLVARSAPVADAADRNSNPQAVELFEKQVRPVLAKHCYSCHGSSQQSSSLRLDSRERMLKGGDKGPAIVADRADDSLLVKAIRHEGLKMPMDGVVPMTACW